MNLVSLATTYLAAAAICAAVYHIITYARLRERHENMTFALLCVTIAFYDYFSAGLYSAADAHQGVVWQTGQMASLCGVGTFTLWFIADLVEQRKRTVEAVFTVYWMVQLVLLYALPTGTIWGATPSVKTIALPHGTVVQYFEMQYGPLIMLQTLVGLLAACYVLHSLLHHYRRGDREVTWPILVGMAAFFLATANDAAIGAGLYQGIYLIEYAYLFLIIAMANAVSIGNLRVRDALKQSESRYRTLYDSMAEGVALHELVFDDAGNAIDYQIKDVNPAFERITNIPRETAHNALASSLYGIQPAPFLDVYAAVAQSGQPTTFETYFAPMDRHFSISVFSPYKNAFATVFSDVSERHRIQQDRMLLAAAVEAAAESIIITRPDGAIVYVNDAFEKMSGYTRADAMGKNPRFLSSGSHSEHFFKQIWDRVHARQSWRGNIRNQRKDGTPYEVECVISPVLNAAGEISHLVAVERDVTPQRALEQQVRESQKMEALGRLAGGVAHDFANLLVLVLNSAQLAKREIPPDSRIHELLDTIDEYGNRASLLIADLLAFAHRQRINLRVIDLRKAIQGAEQMLTRTLDRGIDVRFTYAPVALEARIDPSLIEQLLVQLAVNAQDAMPDSGSLRISTSRIDLSPFEAAQLGEGRTEEDRAAGAFAVLSVSDTGHGIPQDLRTRIFEPFFSTRQSGQSTGLGLSTVYGIVTQHDGHITLESQPGFGTTFHVFVPLITEYRPEPMQRPALNAASVLVASEDALILQMLSAGLRDTGQRVVEATALADLQHMPALKRQEVGVILFDAALQHPAPPRIRELLVKGFPGVPIVFFSSHPRDLLEARGYLQNDDIFLPRPFTLAQAAAHLRRACERGY